LSLSLDLGTVPKGLDVKTYGLKSLPEVRIGEYELSMKDFCYMVEYVTTDTDLEPYDPRIGLKACIESMHLTTGFNKNGTRYVRSEE